VQELFAPAQYFDMSDDDKLAAPSFEAMDAGVVLGADGYTFDFGARVASPFTYTDIAVGPGGVPVTHDDPHGESGERVLALTMLSAASGAATRRTLTWRFEAPVHPLAPTVTPRGWAAVASDGGAAVRTPTWAEARGHVLAASDPSTWVIVPGSEMVST
jgi:hypothetical protein